MQLLFSLEPRLPKPNLPYKTPPCSQSSRLQAQNGRLRPEIGRLFGHNMLMNGSPGSGKTLLARALPGILPEMSIDESPDVKRIYSVADLLPPGRLLIRSPTIPVPISYDQSCGVCG